jgi:hypothetical protein
MNEHSNKIRILRQLKNGTKQTIKKSTYNQYNWTQEEKAFLKPYINSNNPFNVHKTIDNQYVSKFEVYSVLDKYVQNQTTLKNYKSKVNSLFSIMNRTDENFSALFENVNLLIETINSKYKDPTSYFAFLLYILGKSQKLNDIILKNDYDVIKQHFDKSKNKQVIKQLNDRDLDVEYEKVYENIFKAEKELCKNDYGSMKHIIALMYTRALYDENGNIHMNPRNYFVNVKLVNIDSHMNDSDNFYNYNTGKLLINDYKTAGIYQPYKIFLNYSVKKVIYDSLALHPRTFLIEKVKGGLYAGNSLSEMIQRILNYSIDTIRKSIESYEINVKKVSRNHLADVSRHSVITQTVSYLANT